MPNFHKKVWTFKKHFKKKFGKNTTNFAVRKEGLWEYFEFT